MFGTFGKIMGAVAGAAILMLVMDKIWGDRPSPNFMAVTVILVAMATGFECVVDAIKRRD